PLLAIDLGCRDALDSLELLHRGWTVLGLTHTVDSKRRLLAEVPHRESARLTIEIADFGALVLPPADLIYTGSELSFHPAPAFGPVWSRIVPALRPGRWFVGRFLGDRDERSPDPALSFLTRKQVVTLLSGFLVELLRERDAAGLHE